MFIRHNIENNWQQPSQLADKFCFTNKKCFPLEKYPQPAILTALQKKDNDYLLKRNNKEPASVLLRTRGCCAFGSNNSSTASSPFSNRTSPATKNFFLKNVSFLKKNFEVIHSYLKASTKTSDLKLATETKEENDSVKLEAVQLRPKADFDAQRRAFSEPLNSIYNNETNCFFINPVDKSKLLMRYSNSYCKSDELKKEFIKELHFKLVLNALCERNKSLFNTFEFITFRLLKPILNNDDSEAISTIVDSLNSIDSNEISKIKPLNQNDLFKEQIGFSKSMIKFTLCLRRLLNKIDQVIRFHQ